MKFLVLGAGGMAGHIIGLYLTEEGHFVDSVTRRPIAFLQHNLLCDLTDKEKTLSIIKEGAYDCIVNCAGLLNKNADENKKNAIYINSYLPHLIAESIKGSCTKLIQISTDCVFSGHSGKYDEKSIPDGETWYDRTKALGEIVDESNLTLRNSIIGPDINVNGIGLFNWFMKQTGNLNGYDKAIWTGVTTLTLAKAVLKACEQKLNGLYHLVNNETINKFELLKLFNKHFKYSKLNIEPLSSIVVDKSLVNTRKDFDFSIPSYETMIIEMKEWIQSHKQLYPHYSIAR